jgi:signal transduction histidine kinase
VNYYAASSLLNVTFNLCIGAAVFFHHRHRRQHAAFSYFCASVALWSFFYFLWQITDSSESALVMTRALMAAAIWIPAFFFHYTTLLLSPERRFSTAAKISYALAALLTIADVFTPWIVERVEPRSVFPFWPVPGPLFHVHLAMFGVLVLFASLLLWRQMRVSTGIVRLQLKYAFIATVGGFGGGITNYFLWYDIPVRPVATVSVSFYTLVIAYAILRHQFMDIRLVLRDTTLHGVTALLLAGACLALGIPLVTVNPFLAIIVSVFAMAALMAFAYDPIRKALQPAVDRVIFANRFAYLEELGQLPNDLLEFTNLREMLKFLATRLTDAARLERVRIFMYDPAYQSFVETLGEGKDGEARGAEVSETSEWPKLFREDSRLWTVDELARLSARGEILRAELLSLSGVACFPVFREEELLGFVVLGRKRSGEPFNQQDLRILRALRVRLENFLAQAMTITQEALNMVKDSHDMKNDINVLRGRVTWRTMRREDWFNEFGAYGKAVESVLTKLPEEERAAFSEALAKFKRVTQSWYDDSKKSGPIEEETLKRLAHRLRNWAEYGRVVSEGFHGNRKLEAIDVKKAASFSVERWRPMAERKGVKIETDLADGLTVLGEQTLFEQIVENLIDNALKATPKGFVRVTSRKNHEQAVIEIADTGCGIPPEDLAQIFSRPFYQGKGRESLEQSTGVGLYLVAQYARSLGGKVSAESEVGKGSLFRVTLPMRAPSRSAAEVAA